MMTTTTLNDTPRWFTRNVGGRIVAGALTLCVALGAAGCLEPDDVTVGGEHPNDETEFSAERSTLERAPGPFQSSPQAGAGGLVAVPVESHHGATYAEGQSCSGAGTATQVERSCDDMGDGRTLCCDYDCTYTCAKQANGAYAWDRTGCAPEPATDDCTVKTGTGTEFQVEINGEAF